MAIGWYDTPMVLNESGDSPQGRPWRYCAMDDHSGDIFASGGEWEEGEIEPNGERLGRTIVRVRASGPVLRSLPFRELSETEARSLMSPTFPLPRWNGTDIVLGTERAPAKTIDELVGRVRFNAGSADFRVLLSMWTAIGFGAGFRLPHRLCYWLTEHDLIPNGQWWEMVLRALFDQRGAFGDTGILDDFNRANEDPLSDGGNWSSPMFVGDDAARLVSNAIERTGTNIFCEGYRSDQTYGADSESFFTVVTVGDTSPFSYVLARLKDENSALDGYLVSAAGSTTYLIRRLDNESFTTLGASITDADLTDGDKVGIECIGSTIKAFLKDGAAAWGEIGSRTDSTYGAAGHIGFAFGRDNWVLDDCGGGTLAAAGFTPRSYPRGANRGILRGVA